MSKRAFDEIATGLREALAHAQGEENGTVVHQVPTLDVAAIRDKLSMSQAEFAKAFGVSVATIRNWEQGRRAPQGPARVLLLVIDREPDAVRRAIQAA